VTERLTDGVGNTKVLIPFPGAPVEAVLLAQSPTPTDSPTAPGNTRFTACLSSQGGCAMGCAFCQTGTLGLTRNLSAAEMVEQLLALEEIAAARIDNVEFMGMGEPLANLPALRQAIAVITHPQGRGLSHRRITVSTVGLVEGIRTLADQGPPVRLAVSLTTALPDLREALMPVAKANLLPALKAAIAYYTEKSGRRSTLEAVLLGNVNTGDDQARLLGDFAESLGAHVNLIPWNPVPGLPFTRPTAAAARRMLRLIEDQGVSVTLRMSRGQGVSGACGQLGSKTPQ
jgi:23S rRNA (adenine2503-C2)-methyltransferase